ncbi:carbohydrate-binding protein [Streptomyces johnsoniae]|uniref:Alpha-lytic protease prodomain-containing protein n=1 Tax=Streptomyces johnsoniae TaxID=3075532 RepID=A0ABU2SDX2_9ACTN|nr:carbohydrate-binding protein [Streptomyces sp. DSM 41886]MDT0447171.1 alpha-lytic protease prodomain-containing protein [Streptomyces sp. DSM 41886]
MHRRRGAAIAAVAAAAALIATTAPAAAGHPGAAPPATAADTPRLPAGMLDAMQRDLGLDAEQATARAANEHRAALAEPQIRASVGDSFAGSWVQGPTSRLVVATTEEDDVAAIEAAGATAEVVPHSLAELETVKESLDGAAGTHATTGAPVWYVDVTSNTVVLHTRQQQAAETFLAAADVSPERVRIVPSTEQPRPYYDLRGGEAYHINNSGRCSVGFPVTRGTTPGFATAGHCGRAGATTQGHNRVAQGTFQASVFPGRDMAWVAVNSSWTPTPQVAGQGGTTVTVAGSAQAPVGAAICRSGSTTGWHCGQIQQHNTSVTYPEGTITGVTRTSVCAEPGDSGGSYISGDQAQGVTSGGSGNCRTGGTTYHQPINPLLSQFGLTLVTSGNGGPDDPGPGDPGGTWAAGTAYRTGDTVTFGGAEYRCLQGHTAQPGWEPSAAPSLWQRL